MPNAHYYNGSFALRALIGCNSQKIIGGLKESSVSPPTISGESTADFDRVQISGELTVIDGELKELSAYFDRTTPDENGSFV